jgi:peptidoglycan/LPS O-acetylase OafA/YrhL
MLCAADVHLPVREIRLSSTHLPYRPDIDGLRAVAVIIVVLHHAFPAFLTGGFVGVDVFFVISGFIIASSLMGENRSGVGSILAFFGRRIRRLFPALLLVLTTTFAYGFIVLTPLELEQLGKHVAFSALFASNFVLWSEVGYFDTSAVLKPLLHLWSLAIEEQFYILFPFLFLSMVRKRWVFLLPLLIFSSFSLSVLALGYDQPTAFYFPLTRFWELLAGAVLAIWLLKGFGNHVPAFMSNPLMQMMFGFLGLMMIVGSAVFYSQSMQFPGFSALVPVVGSLLVIAAGPAAMINRLVLSNSISVGIGIISYPLYLWHWPLISYLYIIRLGKTPTYLTLALSIGIALVLAILTYRFVERPIRYGGDPLRKTTALLGLMTAVMTAGLITWLSDGLPGRFDHRQDIDTIKLMEARMDPIFQAPDGMSTYRDGRIVISSIGNGDETVIFTGDSLLFHFAPRVASMHEAGDPGRSAVFVTGASCPPVPDVVRSGRFADCDRMPGIVLSLVRQRRIGHVVIGASWTGYASSLDTVLRHGIRHPLDTPDGQHGFFENIADFIVELKNEGADVSVILGVPTHRQFDPSNMLSRDFLGVRAVPDATSPVSANDLRAALTETNRRLIDVAQRTGAHILDPYFDVCGTGPDCSPFFGEKEPKYSDGMHLRPGFVREHVTFLDHLIRPRGDQ